MCETCGGHGYLNVEPVAEVCPACLKHDECPQCSQLGVMWQRENDLWHAVCPNCHWREA